MYSGNSNSLFLYLLILWIELIFLKTDRMSYYYLVIILILFRIIIPVNIILTHKAVPTFVL